jgi:membrane-associated protein
LFKHEYVERARDVLARFGTGRAVVVARFIPIVRTFMNPVAGAIDMPARDFTVWNIVGGIVWVVGLVLLGHYIGNVDVIRNHIELFTLIVIAISIAPLLFHTARETRRARSGRASS